MTGGKLGHVAFAMMMVAHTALAGCAQSDAGRRPVSYRDTARANYEKGSEALEDESFFEAIKYFTFVKNRFPFSRYATLAELRIADAFFAQEKYGEAADAYRLFVRFHPTHPKVLDGYAAFRASSAYVAQIPDSWFLAPPAHEKDQSATQDALREITAFLRRYPDSDYIKEAKQIYQRCITRLIEHELYVARFYLGRGKPKATVMRLEGVLKRFPDADVVPEILLLLGETHLKLKDKTKAKEVFASLVSKFPKDKRSRKAKSYLNSLEGR